MIKRFLLILVVIGVVGGSIFALQQRKAEERAAMSSRAFPPAAVSVAEVQQERWRQSLFAVGSVAAERRTGRDAFDEEDLQWELCGRQCETGDGVVRENESS